MTKIYRGFSEEMYAETIHINLFKSKYRKPIDTTLDVQLAADDFFLKQFGFKARSSSLICSTDIEQARSYGNYTYEIIPLGVSEFLYSKSVKDFLEHQLDIEHPKEINQWITDKNYQKCKYICEIHENFKGEVMVNCSYFILKRV